MMLYESIEQYLSLVTLPTAPPPIWIIYGLVYLLGGVTLLPGIFIFMWYISPSTRNTDNKDPVTTTTTINTMKTWDDEKKGWIRLEEQDQSGMIRKKPGSNSDRFLKISSSSSSTSFYAILRHGTLFCFDSENEKTCHLILPIHDYTISLHPTFSSSSNTNKPPPPRESELYSRIMSICLLPHKNAGSNTTKTYYLTCQRSSDKEDWYFTLLAASRFLLSQDNVNDPSYHFQHNHRRDSTMYDPAAMTHLQRRVGTQPWWYALLGRLFLGIYKTDHWRSLWHSKLTTKLDKLNAHLLQQHHHHGSVATATATSDFVPLELQQIHMGDTIPCLTSMTVDTFDTDGHCVISGQLTYDGDLWAVLRTDFRYLWPFNNSKKQPTNGGGGLVLTLKLRHCSGKVIFKVKPPPSNRLWVAFETMPIMDWQVTPIVGDKQIKWNLVTHLIQAKLKEMILDTLVIPNMEDVPFFDSDGLGGIFGEQNPSATHNEDNVDDGGQQVDSSGDSSEKQQQQQQVPMSKLVQGYISRIKPPHKMSSSSSSSSMSTMHTGSTKATKV